MAAYDDLNDSRIFTVGILSVIVTAVTALAVQVLYHALLQLQLEAKSAQSSYRRQEAALAEQADAIEHYGVDPTTGNVTIPIQQAIKLLVTENQSSDDKGQTQDQT